MTRQTLLWVVRDEQGHLHGPYSTEKILEDIRSGRFEGHESISEYPGGKWVAMSSSPEFSDPLLDQLAREAKPSRSAKAVREPEKKEKDAPPRTEKAKTAADEAGTNSQLSLQASSYERKQSQREKTAIIPPKPPGHNYQNDPSGAKAPVIELTDLSRLARSKTISDAKGPVLLLIGAIFLIAYGMSGPGKKHSERLHLLGPRSKQPQITKNEAAQLFEKGYLAFEQDTFSTALRAQNSFVQLVEGAPSSPEGYSALCLIYRELWPFVAQDAQDLQVISQVQTMAHKQDPAGVHGAICDIVQFLLTGRYPEARGLVESWAKTVEGAPPLLEIQGAEALESKDFHSALFYFQSARALRPKWAKLSVEEARARAGLSDYNGAAEMYRHLVNSNPSHQVARIELGILEHTQFSHDDKAIDFLRQGLGGSDRVPRLVAARGYFAEAEIYISRGEKSRALDLAQKAYALDSTNDDASKMILALGGKTGLGRDRAESQERLYLVEQYVQAGDFLAAQAAAKAAFEQDPKNAVAALKAAENLWKINQSADAIDWMKKAIISDPQFTLAYVELADYYSQRYDYLSAYSVLRKIQSIHPRAPEVYRGFASLELNQHNYKGAVDAAQKALQLYDADSETFLLIAKAQMGLGNFVEAQKYSGRAIEMDKGDVDAQCVNAQVLAGLKGTEEAVQYLKQILISYPYVVDYRITLGEIYFRDERYQAALDAFSEALSIAKDKNNKRIILGRGKAYAALGKRTEALDSFLQAAIADPTDAQALFLAGEVYSDQGRIEEAVAQFQRVLRNNPHFPKAHIMIGRAFLKLNRFHDAIEQAEQEKTDNPRLTDAYLLAGNAKYLSHDYSGCAQEYQKALALASNSTDTYVALARCYRLSGSLDAAVSILRQAESLESGYAPLYKEYGAIYHTKGMVDEAIKAYNTYLNLSPNAPDRNAVERARDRLPAGDFNLQDEEL